MGLPLLTERLELRAFDPDDLDALHAVYGDPEVTRFIPAYPTLEHTRRAVLDYALGPLALSKMLELVRPANAASINTRNAYGAEHLVYLTVSVPSMPAALWPPTGQ